MDKLILAKKKVFLIIVLFPLGFSLIIGKWQIPQSKVQSKNNIKCASVCGQSCDQLRAIVLEKDVTTGNSKFIATEKLGISSNIILAHACSHGYDLKKIFAVANRNGGVHNINNCVNLRLNDDLVFAGEKMQRGLNSDIYSLELYACPKQDRWLFWEHWF